MPASATSSAQAGSPLAHSAPAALRAAGLQRRGRSGGDRRRKSWRGVVVRDAASLAQQSRLMALPRLGDHGEDKTDAGPERKMRQPEHGRRNRGLPDERKNSFVSETQRQRDQDEFHRFPARLRESDSSPWILTSPRLSEKSTSVHYLSNDDIALPDAIGPLCMSTTTPDDSPCRRHRSLKLHSVVPPYAPLDPADPLDLGRSPLHVFGYTR